MGRSASRSKTRNHGAYLHWCELGTNKPLPRFSLQQRALVAAANAAANATKRRLACGPFYYFLSASHCRSSSWSRFARTAFEPIQKLYL